MSAGLIASFSYGLICAVAAGTLFRILSGMRLHLYLMDNVAQFSDQAIIPITSENKRTSFFKTLLKGRWRENMDLTLLDNGGQKYHFAVGYSLWRRYYLVLLNECPKAFVGRTPVKRGKRYFLSTGTRLHLGDRTFKILITPKSYPSDILRSFAEHLIP